MGFTRRTSGAVGVWAAFIVCGVHQAVAGGDPPAPAVPVKADATLAAPAATPASTTTVTEGTAPAATPASTTTGKEGAARLPAVVIKTSSLKDPVLTNDEVKRLLSQGYTQENLSNGDVQYCRKEASLGSMVPKRKCVTGGQLKVMAEDKRQFNDLVQEKAGANPRPAGPN